MKITARTQMLCHQYGIKDTLEIFARKGFEGVEFSFEDKNFQPRYDMLDDYFLDYISKCAIEFNIPILSAGSHMNYVDSDENFQYTIEAIQKTSRLHTNIFIITAASTPEAHVRKTVHREKAVERIKQLVEVAEKNEIILALEPEPGHVFQTTEEVMDLFEKINSDYLGCNFDMGHSFLMDANIYDSIELLNKKIVHGHIEDMPRGRHMHLMPAEGDMDLPKVIHTLKGIGFQGALALDVYQYDYYEVCEDAYKIIKKYLQE